MGVPLGTGEALTLVGFLALLLRMQNPGCSLCGHFSGLHLEGGTQRDLTAQCKMGVPHAQGSSAMTPTSCGHSSHLYPYRIMQGPGGQGDASKHNTCSLQWSWTIVSSSSVHDTDLGWLTSFKQDPVRPWSLGPPPAISYPSP